MEGMAGWGSPCCVGVAWTWRRPPQLRSGHERRLQAPGNLLSTSRVLVTSMRGTPVERQDVERLGAAYVEHRLTLLRLGVLLTGREDMGEDLVQEAFTRALDKLGGLEDDAIRPYLRATVLNLWRNRLRRFSLEPRFRDQPLPAADLAFEERDAFWSAIRRLPARRRACLVLRYFEDLPERETAELLKCSEGTVKSQTSKALARLKQELDDEDPNASTQRPSLFQPRR